MMVRRRVLALIPVLAVFVPLGAVASEEGILLAAADAPIRIVSWNISSDKFVTDQAAFRALTGRAAPDVLLLDEVAPSTGPDAVRRTLSGLDDDPEPWNILFGESGGSQRGVIASRAELEAVPELSGIVPYPAADHERIRAAMPAEVRRDPRWSLAGGIPVQGGIVTWGGRRLLIVILDLTCCGGDPADWNEGLRRIEAREIRRRLRAVLAREAVDGVVIAGDFNLVSRPIPLVLLAGPYDAPHGGLTPVEVLHADGRSTWTWDGRGTQFPSSALDYQLYSAGALSVQSSLVLDTEGLPASELEEFGLRPETSKALGRHRPLVVEYAWR